MWLSSLLLCTRYQWGLSVRFDGFEFHAFGCSACSLARAGACLICTHARMCSPCQNFARGDQGHGALRRVVALILVLFVSVQAMNFDSSMLSICADTLPDFIQQFEVQQPMARHETPSVHSDDCVQEDEGEEEEPGDVQPRPGAGLATLFGLGP